jgi:hypothetical protein
MFFEFKSEGLPVKEEKGDGCKAKKNDLMNKITDYFHPAYDNLLFA